MSMAVGKKGVKSDINITPYIDILLVLLIIFMSTAPMKPKDHPIRVPQQATKLQKPDPQPTIIVEMEKDHTVKLNEEAKTYEELETELTQILSKREVRNMFVRADQDLNYGDVFVLLDIAKQSGATDIALLVKKTKKDSSATSEENR